MGKKTPVRYQRHRYRGWIISAQRTECVTVYNEIASSWEWLATKHLLGRVIPTFPCLCELRCVSPFFSGNFSCKAVMQVVYYIPAGVPVELWSARGAKSKYHSSLH